MVEYKYLIMITANNNNKYYEMIPSDDGSSFTVKYGRVGSGCQTSSYSISQWNKKYNEKIKKGYVDQTDIRRDLVKKVVVSSNNDGKKYKAISNRIIAEFVERLQAMAKQTIRANYKVKSASVTSAMVNKAQEVIDYLALNNENITVDDFNKKLIELFGVIPRRMDNVNNHLCRNKNDFISIIKREQDLLDVMRGQVVQHEDELDDTNVEKFDNDELTALGLSIRECTSSEIEHIKDMLAENKHRFKCAYRVENVNTRKKFDEYCKSHNITDIREFWHGSRNQNIWSISTTGWKIRPASQATNGSMLGRGTYMANEARKSMTYAEDFLFIADCAYGKPYDIHRFDSKYYTYDYASLQRDCKGANCLHAHKGMYTGWCNIQRDEIVFYEEPQVTIKYIVELN